MKVKMLCYLVPLLLGVGILTTTPKDAEARRFCWNHCTYQQRCYNTKRCYRRPYCRSYRTRCYWRQVCRGGNNFLDDGGCRRQRVCNRRRYCTYRRYCRNIRRCYPRRVCRRICENVPNRKRRYKAPRQNAQDNWLDSFGDSNQPTYRRTSPRRRYKPQPRYQPQRRRYVPPKIRKRIFAKHNAPPSRRTPPGTRTPSGKPQLPGVLMFAGLDNKNPAKRPTPQATAAQKKAAAALNAKMAKMKRQLAMLSKLREERLQRLKALARQEALRKQKIKQQENQRRERLQRLEQQRKARLAALEKQLQAKSQKLAATSKRLNKTQQKKLRRWQQQLAQLKAQRSAIARQMDDKRKHLQKLQALARKEEKRALRRRRIHKTLLNQEKAEIDAIRRQRLAERKRLAYFRRLVARQKKLQQERRKLIARAKVDKSAKARRRRARRLAKLRKEADKIKNTQKKLGKKKLLARTALQHFNKGSCSQAAAYFKRAGRSELGKKLTEFETKMRMGRGAYGRRNTTIAIPLLERALTLDLEIGGGRSRFTPTIRMMLANLYMIKGRIEMSSNDFADAFLYFRTARRYKPKHRMIKRYLAQLRVIAQRNYKLATTQYKSNRRMRRRCLNKVTRLLYPKDPLYRKAIKELNKD